MSTIAQYHVNGLLEGSPVAKEYRRTLMAMPVRVFSPESPYQCGNSSIEFKQYAFYDLERRGLIELGVFGVAAPYTHISDPITQWRLTELGAEVVELLKEAAE
jgi:hypothetical protein